MQNACKKEQYHGSHRKTAGTHVYQTGAVYTDLAPSAGADPQRHDGYGDTLMVAGVGEAAVSSVSLVDSLNILIIQILSALATGGAVIASQYLGRKDTENAGRSAAQLYSVLGLSTVTMGILCMLLSRPILRGVFGSIDEDVMRFAQQYFLISAVSYPFIGLYNGGAALFRAQGNSRISMLASLVMNVINIAGNALLIYGFGMGVIGAALATLIGRVFAAVFILWQNQDLHNPLRVQHFADLRPPAQAHHADFVHRHPVGSGKRHVPDWQAVCQQPDVYLRHLGHRGQCRGKLGLDAGEHPRPTR